MSSFAGSITALFVAGMVGGYAGLCVLGPTDETQTTAVAAATPIPDPPVLPCSMQAWPNADRKCLDWTAPRAEVADAKTATTTDGAQKAAAPSPGKRATTAAQPSTVGMSVAATQPAAEAADAPAAAATPVGQAETPAKAAAAKSRTAAHTKAKALAVMRGFGDNLNDLRLNAYAYDGSSRRSANRSAQARYYGGARSGGWWW